ncbi:MAG: LacI family DNA-binding transcriptional regulator [Eubacteriales bacterium]
MVSIRDVASKAGVAISTVSKVLNNYPNVSEQTKQKVNEAIKELNFVPNTVASALSSKQGGRVAMLMNLNTNTQAIDEIGMQYIYGGINQCKEMNLDVIVVFYSMVIEMTGEEVIRYFKSQHITGLIIYGMSRLDKNLHDLIDSQEFKIVVVDSDYINESTSAVGIDHKTAQKEVARKTLQENNCKRVLYISGKDHTYVTEQRLRGMRELIEEDGLTIFVRNGNFSELQARKITFQYGQYADAIVCASDLMAIGAMNALTEMDIFRPVCGFDGITLMGYVGKQMNTVHQDFSNVSKEAVCELHCLMEGKTGKNKIIEHEMARLEYLEIIR